MIAKHAIDDSIPFLKLTDKVFFALELMEEYKLFSLPIITEEKLYGIVSEDQLLEIDESLTLEQLEFPLIKIAVNDFLHIFDVMKLGYENNSDVIPVINKEENYLGLITKKSILNVLQFFSFAKEQGGILVLEVDVVQYSLSEITRIVESNKALVLSVATSSVKDNIDKINVTIKVNVLDLTYILASFERYDYSIVSVFHKAEQIDQLQERYDALMYYMNI